MSTFRYQGNPNEVLNKKTLPKDQQKLADAAANSGSPSAVDSITSNAAFEGLEAATDSAFTTGAAGGVLNFAAKRAGSAALGAAGGTLSAYTPHAAALYGGYKAGQALDEQFGLSDKLASGIAGFFGYDVNKGAITDEERASMARGENPAVTNSEAYTSPFGAAPVYDFKTQGPSGEFKAVSEKLLPKPEQEIQQNKVMDSQEFSPLEGLYQAKDGRMMGQFKAPNAQSSGMTREASPEQIAQFNEGLSQSPMVSGTPQEGLKAFTDARGNVAYGNEAAISQFSPAAPTQSPQAPQMTVGEEAQANFEKFKASGQEMTLDQVTQATELAEAAGRTFNEETGYSKDFDPVEQEAYKQEVAERSPQPATPSEAPSLDASASEARSNYARESAAREARMDEKSSARTQMRVGGEMVPATEENRKRSDLEKSLKAQAKRDGLTPAETRTYVADSMRERSQDTEDRAVQKEMNDLNLSSSQARLAVTLKSLQPEAAKKMTENEFSGFIGMMEKMGVSLDPESGALLQVEDGVFIDSTKPLSPNSELFQKVMELEGGAEFLAAPSAVKGDLTGQPVGTKSMSEDGTNRVWEVIDANGTLKQVR